MVETSAGAAATSKKKLPTWRKAYMTSVRQLQTPAAIVLTVCIGLTALLPILEYVLILRHDKNVNIAFAAAIWAGCGMIWLLGLWAYHGMTPMLLGAHAALVCIAGSAMVVSFTSVYFSADVRCAIVQSALEGCDSCPCAANNDCTTDDISGSAAQSGCETCSAWGRDTCASILADSSIAGWGAIVMAPLLAVVTAASLLLSQRVSAQKQALSQIISECRTDVSVAYKALQQKGRISGISIDDLRSALKTMWDTADTETQDEVRAFIEAARKHGYYDFDRILNNTAASATPSITSKSKHEARPSASSLSGQVPNTPPVVIDIPAAQPVVQETVAPPASERKASFKLGAIAPTGALGPLAAKRASQAPARLSGEAAEATGTTLPSGPEDAPRARSLAWAEPTPSAITVPSSPSPEASSTLPPVGPAVPVVPVAVDNADVQPKEKKAKKEKKSKDKHKDAGSDHKGESSSPEKPSGDGGTKKEKSKKKKGKDDKPAKLAADEAPSPEVSLHKPKHEDKDAEGGETEKKERKDKKEKKPKKDK